MDLFFDYAASAVFIFYFLRQAYWFGVYVFVDKWDASEPAFSKATDLYSWLLLGACLLLVSF